MYGHSVMCASIWCGVLGSNPAVAEFFKSLFTSSRISTRIGIGMLWNRCPGWKCGTSELVENRATSVPLSGRFLALPGLSGA